MAPPCAPCPACPARPAGLPAVGPRPPRGLPPATACSAAAARRSPTACHFTKPSPAAPLLPAAGPRHLRRCAAGQHHRADRCAPVAHLFAPGTAMRGARSPRMQAAARPPPPRPAALLPSPPPCPLPAGSPPPPAAAAHCVVDTQIVANPSVLTVWAMGNQYPAARIFAHPGGARARPAQLAPRLLRAAAASPPRPHRGPRAAASKVSEDSARMALRLTIISPV